MAYAKLRGAIREMFGTQAAFAKEMKMHPATLSAKLSGKKDWTGSEMETAAKLIGIPMSDVAVYFFD